MGLIEDRFERCRSAGGHQFFNTSPVNNTVWEKTGLLVTAEEALSAPRRFDDKEKGLGVVIGSTSKMMRRKRCMLCSYTITLDEDADLLEIFPRSG